MEGVCKCVCPETLVRTHGWPQYKKCSREEDIVIWLACILLAIRAGLPIAPREQTDAARVCGWL